MHDSSHAAAATCPACATALQGAFCSGCGQPAKLHPPSAGEFVHEFIGHYVAFEGRLWRTLRLLFTGPGSLTKEYLAGRRIMYVEPLRLYLTMSLLFFVAMHLFGVRQELSTAPVAERPTVATYSADLGAFVGSVRVLEDGARIFSVSFNLREVDSALSPVRNAVSRVFPPDEERMARFEKLDERERFLKVTAGVFSKMPYAVFLMLPVFAFLVKLTTWRQRRPFGEHLLFALHYMSFVFAIMLIQIPVPAGWLLRALTLSIPLYLAVAVYRVYGGARTGALLRALLILPMYVYVTLCALQVVLVLSVG